MISLLSSVLRFGRTLIWSDVTHDYFFQVVSKYCLPRDESSFCYVLRCFPHRALTHPAGFDEAGFENDTTHYSCFLKLDGWIALEGVPTTYGLLMIWRVTWRERRVDGGAAGLPLCCILKPLL